MPGRTTFATIFASVFLPDGNHLLAADSLGRLFVWEMNRLFEASYWEEAAEGHKPGPTRKHQLHDCSIFCLKLLGDDVLLTGADDCIKAWRLSSLLTPGSEPALLSTIVHPQEPLGRGAMMPVAETNGLAANASNSHFISAAGDGTGYVWDSATMTCKAKLKGHTDYLHCVACEGENTAVTGSEDGTVRIWDVRDAANAEELAQSGGSPKAWVGALDVEQEGNWLAGGGGARCLWLWHIASRKVVAAMPTCGSIQSVSFCGDKIMSAGAESALYQWKRSGNLHSRVATAEESTFTIAHRALNQNTDSRVLVTGGTSPELAVYYRSGAELGFYLTTTPEPSSSA